MPLRVGVLGLWGHEEYARTVLADPDVELAAVAGYDGPSDEVRARLDQLVHETGVPFYDDPMELLRRVPLDAAVVQVPPAINHRVAAACLVKGLPTLCEKPLSGSTAATAYLAQALRVADAPLLAALALTRYGQPWADLLARRGEVGQPQAASFRYLATGGPRHCTSTPHFRDDELPATALSGGEAAIFSGYGVLWLEAALGQRICAVRAELQSQWYPAYLELRCEDYAVVELRCDGGATGRLELGRLPEGDLRPRLAAYLQGRAGALSYTSESDGPSSQSGVAALVDDFLTAARSGRPTRLSSRDLLQTCDVLAAVYRSGASGEWAAVEPSTI
ncbi:MAG: Gfo/Idh/MocA family oxidoreductase [Fimbriimonadaceae bacterium]|nr:Gfo/Idh/MocA family oxidoreductase [Fimbriimonadaceae bacterium]